MKKIWITFLTSIKSLMNLNQNFQHNLFYLKFISYPYDQNKQWPSENFQKNWKENWKELGQPDSCFWS